MNDSAREPVATAVKGALAKGDVDAAVTHALEGYGSEVLGFLVALLRDADAADDVFSQFCEDVWHGLASFRGDSSLRAWLYSVARHAAARYHRVGYLRRRVPLSWAPLAELEARMRTQTLTFLQTAQRSAVDRLRDELAPEERALLILRVDRKLGWNDIAAIMAEDGSSLDPDQLKREAALLRKRFERVKDRLRKLAQAAGLLGNR